MNKEKIKKILSTINYPGFSRDIVSFGMVKSIDLSDNEIVVNLSITSQNNKKKQILVNNIEEEFSNYFSKVVVNIDEKINTENSIGPMVDSNNQPLIDSPILEGVKNIIAIASGKGGVGKSTVASNIACGLEKRGNKVGLLDLDIYGPSLPIIFGINHKPEMSADNKLIPILKYGIKVMSFGFISGNDTPVIWRGPLVSRMTEQFFKDVEWGELDYLVLDLPPGTGDIQLTLTQKLRMSGAIIITTPQDIALSDVRKGADMFKKVKTPILGVIENMSGFGLQGVIKSKEGELIKEGIITLQDGTNVEIDNKGFFKINLDLFKEGGGLSESKRLDIPLLGKIPISPSIVLSTDSGEPIILVEDSNSLSKIYFSIVDQVIKITS